MNTPSEAARRQREAVFFQIHKDLPREGPGDAASTHRAFQSIRGLPVTGRILDVGCGPGAQTIDLANLATGGITALDIHGEYLGRLRDRLQAAGLTHRVNVVQASMLNMPFLNKSFDLIWAEGAIYIVGFERGLQDWRRLLRPGGYVVVTHLSWLADDVPEEPRNFWRRSYPAMRAVDENIRMAAACGFDLVECFTLPESAWWIDYYSPMETRLLLLRQEYAGDSEALAVVESSSEQIDLYRRFARYYGYVFYVLRMR